MKEAHVYLGHSIGLDVTRAQEGFTYSYFIDGSYCFEGAVNSSDIESARAEILSKAHRSIAFLVNIEPVAASRSVTFDNELRRFAEPGLPIGTTTNATEAPGFERAAST